MSWSLSVNAQYADAVDAITNAAASPDTDKPEQVEQVQAGKDAAIALIKSLTVVNDAEQDVGVSISGHANPAHKPAAGYGNDCIYVSISQVTRQAGDA